MYDLYIVHRTQIYLDEGQEAVLARRAAAAGISKSTLIREAIDAYLRDEDEGTRLAAFRAAVAAASGAARDLPRGADYVRESRDNDLRREERLEARRRG